MTGSSYIDAQEHQKFLCRATTNGGVLGSRGILARDMLKVPILNSIG